MEVTPIQHFKLSVSVICFIAGLLVMILSSVVWVNFKDVYAHTKDYDITVGDVIATSGQTAGQMFWCLTGIYVGVALRDFVKIMQVLYIFAYFGFMLGVYDLIDILFLNPYEVSVPKFLGFVVATIVTIIRLSWTTKN